MIVSDQVDTECLKRIKTNLNRDSQAMKDKEIVEIRSGTLLSSIAPQPKLLGTILTLFKQ